MKKIRFITIFAAVLVSAVTSRAENIDTLSLRIYFRQGEHVIDDSFRFNGDAISKFNRDINAILSDPDAVIHSICVETGTSPEGGVKYNEELAMKRARSIRKRLIDNLALSPSQIKAYSSGINWEGLVTTIRRSDCPWRNEILAAITEYSVRTEYDIQREEKCKKALMKIDDGKAWRWMEENVFEDLRLGAGVVRCIISREDAPSRRDTVVIVHEYEGPDATAIASAATSAALTEMALASEKPVHGYRTDSLFRKPVFAFRTNLLFPAMSIGFEVPIGNRVSVGADWYYPWIWREWTNRIAPANKYCIEAIGAYADVRLWLGHKHRRGAEYSKYRLCGHSIGVVATLGYLDFAWNDHELSMQEPWTGRQGEYWGVGLSYMYSLPLGRKGWGRMEFEIAAGYYSTIYRPYSVYMEGGALFADGYQVHKHGFYPIKAGINLVVPIFSKEK